MNDGVAIEALLGRVARAHKFKPLSWLRALDESYRVTFENTGKTHETVIKWFADAGGEVTQVGYLPLDNEHYLVVRINE